MKKIYLSIITGTVLAMVMPILASAEILTRQLEQGMTGTDVSSLQTFLAKDPAIYPQGLVTGYFGSLTKVAVSNFQARNGIAVVGRVGPITMATINAQMGATTSSSPIINAVNVGVATTSVTFNWNTSKNTYATIYYSTSPLSMTEASASSGVMIGGSSFVANSDLRAVHSATLTALSPNTTYYYVIYVRDESGNENITWPATFKTNQ